MIRMGVIGYGYWGPNLVKSFVEGGRSRVIAVSDLHEQRLALVRARYPSITPTTDYRELLADQRIDAVAIATPVSSHFELAMRALRAGKHVLVEKPLAATSEQAHRLIEAADRAKRILMVDHTFIYTGAVRKIQQLLAAKDLGEVYYYDSVRVNLGLFQHDVNVIWDLAVHDLSIMDFVLHSRPCAVSALGMSHVDGKPENIAYLTLLFKSRMIAHIHVNWLAPAKVRRTLIGGSRKMIVYDDLEPSEKIKVYDKGITIHKNAEKIYQTLIAYRTGDMWAPQLGNATASALDVETAHFIHCIEHGKASMTDGRAGLRVVRILEAASRSMAHRGRLVELDARA